MAIREEEILKRYISEHPDYWEFENELREVTILKKRIKQAASPALRLEK